MEPFLVILLILVCFGSIITTFVAIIRILSNEFNGSKGMWILISMIGIVGPILWLTKGRKLIVKK
jgi:hypothetical protein